MVGHPENWLPWQPHLHLNNSIVLSSIKFILARRFPGKTTTEISHTPHFCGSLVAMATKEIPQ